MSMSENSTTLAQSQMSPLAAESGEAGPRQADIACAWAEWVAEFALWKSMITLTVSNKHPCTRDTFIKRVRTLVQILNRDLYGNHYIRMVGHSYFSHILGIEYMTSDVIHGHFLVDRPLNFQLVHDVWEKISGFAFISPVSDIAGVARYVCKYVVKYQDLELIYKSTSHKSPHSPIPFWYSENL